MEGFDHRIGHFRPLRIIGTTPNSSALNGLGASTWDRSRWGGRRHDQGRILDNKWFRGHFGDIPFWNILASGVILPYISSYPCVTTLMRQGHGRSVVPETASMAEGARFRLHTGHPRPDPLVT